MMTPRRSISLTFRPVAAFLLAATFAPLQAQSLMPIETWKVKAEQKISAAAGGLGTALNNFDYLGLSLGSADVNGDGRRELLACIPGDDEGGINRGSLMVLFLNADGTIQSEVMIAQNTGGFNVTLDDSDYFGRGVMCIGDLDNDGFEDIACSAYRDDDGGFDAGAVYILFMNPDGTVKSHQKISLLQGSFTGGVLAGDVFGIRVAALGDLDGDGVEDIVSTASLTDAGGHDRGVIYVLFLNTDGTVKGHQRIGAGEGGLNITLQDDDYFGCHVTCPGDVNEDGIVDLVVGAFGDDDGGTGIGAVYVLFMKADGTVQGHQKISATQGGLPTNIGPGDHFGSSIDTVGDIDGDGRPTIIVGAYDDDDGGLNRGAVWLLELDTDGTVANYRKVSQTKGGFGGILKDTEGFGSGLTSLGDIDDDGVVDLGVGAWFSNEGGVLGGAVWVLRMAAPSLVKNKGPIAAPVAASAALPPAHEPTLPMGGAWRIELESATGAPVQASAILSGTGPAWTVVDWGRGEHDLRLPEIPGLHGATIQLEGVVQTIHGLERIPLGPLRLIESR